jgi:hypothetical protein
MQNDIKTTITDIKDKLARATQGEWEAVSWMVFRKGKHTTGSSIVGCRNDEDAAFIAAAHNGFTAIADYIADLEARLARSVELPCAIGDVGYEVDPSHGIVKHTVTGISAVEREVAYADGMRLCRGVTIETKAEDECERWWTDHYTADEWDKRLTRPEAEQAMNGGAK